MFKKKVLAVVLCMTVMFLFGCDFFSPATTTKNTADTTDTTTVSTSEVTSTETDITLQLTYIYNLAVSTNAFTGTYEEWLESVRGPQGIPGKSVELQVAGGYVQWKYSDETTWKNLVEIASLKGEAGDSVLFQVTGEFIQWKYTNDTDWTNLLDLSTLSGPAGADGKDVTFQVADGYIQWKYLDDTVWTNLVDLIDLTGTDGREVEFNVSATHIQWRYAGETTWVDLVELAILTGADGETGTDGKQIELNVSSTIIQWRYVGDTEWIDLMDLTDLYGTVNNYFTDFALLHDLARNSDIYTVIGDIVCIYDTGYFLYDGVNVLHVYNPYHGLYEAGDRLEVTGHYTYYQGNWQISAITNEVLVSEGNPLTISPNEITLESMLNLSVYDKMTYAEYYSFTTVLDDYFYYYLETGTGISFNENISDELFDKLMQYGNLYGREVRFEGFIYRFLDANHIEFFINDFEVLDYRIYFETYGFDYIEPMFLKYNDPITTLPVPQAEGYSFLGWYLDEDFTTPFTLTTMPDFDLVLYAKFNRAPEIYGVEESFISLGSVFDPLFDVYAYDEEDGDLTSSIVYTGNIDVNAEGKYILTYSVTDSDGATSEVTRIINVVSSTVTYPTGYFNFKYATPELRLTFVAAAEKYLLNTMYGGVPLYANGTFDIYSDRILLPVDNYIPVMGYGAKFATMDFDDSTVIMYNDLAGEAGKFTYRTATSYDLYNWNQWLYDNSYEAGYLELYLDSLYTYEFNSEETGFSLNPSMASDEPMPVDSYLTENDVLVANTWRIPLRNDLEWYYHPDTDISGLPYGHQVINANDFIQTYKLALDQNWFRAISGGGDFISNNFAILNAEQYLYGGASWEDVGLKVIDDYTIEFTFMNHQSAWDVKYFLGDFLMTPINIELYEYLGGSLTDSGVLGTYGTSNLTTAYHGPYYVDYSEFGNYSLFEENPNYHSPDKYFYTGYSFVIVPDVNTRFQQFIEGKLDYATLPLDYYDEYSDYPGLKRIPGATTFRMMINGFGTEQAQREIFPNGTWIPEPILASHDFKMAMYYAIDRKYLAEEVLKTSTTQMYLFSDVYMVDPDLGVPFRMTDQGLSVGEGLSPSTFGFNSDLAKTYFSLAIDDLVNNGIYQPGTAWNYNVIELDFNIFSGNDAQVLMGDFIKNSFESYFISEEHYIRIQINVIPTDFPSIYYDHMMTGEFDLAIGGISGSTLDAASFLDTYCDDNRGGFTLNWGIDTTTANVPVQYFDYEGVYHNEIWSFNAITEALNGTVYVVNGVEMKSPEVVITNTTPTTLTFFIDEINNPMYKNFRYTLQVFNFDTYVYDNVAGYVNVLATFQEITLSGLLPYPYDYQILVTYEYTDESVTDIGETSAWEYMKEIVEGMDIQETSAFIILNTNDRTRNVSSGTVRLFENDVEVLDANIVISGNTISITGLKPETYYYVTFDTDDGFTDPWVVAYGLRAEFITKASEIYTAHTIEEALSQGAGAYVKLIGMTVIAKYDTGDIFFTDGTDILYIYSPTFESEVGDVLNITGIVNYYYDAPQLIGTLEQPLLAEDSIEIISDIPNNVEYSVYDLLAEQTIPSSDNKFEYRAYQVTGRVYYNPNWDNYSVFLVPSDYDFSLPLEDNATKPNGDSLLIYYRTNDEVLQAFHGQEVTIDVITIGYRTDKLLFYAGFFGTEADVFLVSPPLTDLEKIDYDINSINIGGDVYLETAVVLPTTGFYGSNISWVITTDTGGNASYDSTTSLLTITTPTDSDIIELTATFTLGTESQTAIFTFYLTAVPLVDLDQIPLQTLQDLVMVHGVVYAVIQNGFFIEDATGQLFVYTTAVTYEVGAEVELIGEVGSYGGEYQLINLVTNPSALSFFNQINMSPELYKHTTTILEAGQLYTVIGKVAIEGPYSNVYIYLNETEKFEIYYKSPQSSIDALKAYAGELVAVDIIYNNSGTRFVYVGETEGVRLCTEVTDLSDLLFMDDGSWVLVKGIVTFNSFDGLFIQDSLGLGLFMYKPEETNISIGDEVIYLGELSTYSGARQLAYGAKLAEVLTIGNSLIVTPITADGIDAFSITDVGRLYSFDGFTYEGLDPNDNRHMILGYTLYDGVTTGTVSVRYYENYPDMILVADNYTVGDTLPLVEFLLYNFRDGLTQINVASVDFTDTDKLLLDANALPESLILTSDYVIPTPEHGSTYTVIDISSELVDLIEEVTIPGTLLVIRPLDGEPDAVGTITIRVNNGAITPIEVVIQVTIPAEPPVTVGPEVVTASYLGTTSTNMVDGNNAELV